MLTNKQKREILRGSAVLCGLDGHITCDVGTSAAERMMRGSSRARNPHKNSYLRCDSVDACFFIENDLPFVTFTARWGLLSKDLSLNCMTDAIILINSMLMAIHDHIAEFQE